MSATTDAPTTEQPLKSEAADTSQPKVTPPKAEAKSKKQERPEPVAFKTLKEGDKVRAYHPRLHPDIAQATVLRDLAVADTYVRVKFAKGDPITTHRQNVYPGSAKPKAPAKSKSSSKSNSSSKETAAAAA